ncbi:hypothetical protein DAT35_21350 [Vitiosangium sp. GDMCC 1.1324]|nr:hypothetical protein DAT35_21350 [Vitiosangium sp. GDMCC 1.1324]
MHRYARRSKPTEKLLRQDRLELQGESIPVEVFERTTSLMELCGDEVYPFLGRQYEAGGLVEEVWKRVGAPRAEGPLWIRYDQGHSLVPPKCIPQLASSTRAPDAEGFIDVRRVLEPHVEAVIDGWVYPCMQVRTWNRDDVPIDSLECPGVLGGRARWEAVQRFSDGRMWKDRIEVVSFDCRR